MPEPFDVLAALIRVDRSPSLTFAARSLAAAGVPVFPCLVDGKRPLTRRGFLDASNDPERIAAWWSRTPNANIGIPTGAASGAVVVDVDVHGTHDGRAAYKRATDAGLVDGAGLLVRTPTGGAHVYFPATPGSEQRSWQAATAGVDFRGDGGYIIAPPSRRIIDGNVKLYEVADIAAHSVGAVDAARLRDFLDPRPVAPPRPSSSSMEVDAERLAAWVAGRGEGERNRGLFWAACRLAENGISPADALDALGAAAQSAGLGDREITTTVRSAYRATQPAPDATPGGRAQSAGRWFGRTASPPSAALGRAGL
ncbi:bifunctional DNA primase/polymerase [Brevibacterium casei]|uniref:bifunctional DNA primase/polymerase n=1 Tax=Brevibacterium casei TaxID=33889 RepID=UPI0028ADB3B7|nr:bifunctional DNA primase/polymerase [Brevibacterium casei]